MIERFDNAIQIVVLLICCLISAYRAFRQNSKAWTLLAIFFGGMMLGDLYWVLCLVFYGSTPGISLVSDLNWFSSYLILYLLLRQVAPPVSAREKRVLPWLSFLFTLGMAGFFYSFYIDWTERLGMNFVLWDKALNNLAYGMLMGLLMFSAIRRLMDKRIYPKQKSLCITVLVFCLLEYALWTSSCFWFPDTLAYPYYWFDFLLTICELCLLPATKKAVAE